MTILSDAIQSPAGRGPGGLVDFQRGNLSFNANELLRCGAGFGPLLCEVNYRPEKYPTTYVAQTGNYVALITAGTIDQFFQDASYFKLREVSATYMVPERFIGSLSAASITISARELATWTDYRGVDPDMSDDNDQALLPTLSRLTAILNIRF